jgi:hypothetical protein
MFKCLCVVQGGCDMCIRFNRNFMFCTDRNIHLSFRLCWEYAASALGNIHLTTRCYGNFQFPSSRTFWDFRFTACHCGISILPHAKRINVTFQYKLLTKGVTKMNKYTPCPPPPLQFTSIIDRTKH